jgi:energy-converting hydrogenase Eha subunit C
MESDSKINVWWLFLAGTALLSAGWWMRPFPVFMFVGFAPFFAIVDHTIEGENFWENMEVILLGMAVSLISAFLFDLSSLVMALVVAIIFTLPFLGFAYVHENLGARTGKFIIIILWLGIEYTLVKVQWPSQAIFLADAFQFTGNWARWNNETGYLGVSAWILFANWIFYAAILRHGVNWFLIFLGLAIVIGPIVYSLMLSGKPLQRVDMMALYSGGTVEDIAYAAKGELVARTCAWLSVLIVLFAVVKSSISKKS